MKTIRIMRIFVALALISSLELMIQAAVTKKVLEKHISKNLARMADREQNCNCLIQHPTKTKLLGGADNLSLKDIEVYKQVDSQYRQAACALCGDFMNYNSGGNTTEEKLYAAAYAAICKSLSPKLPQPILNTIASKLRESYGDSNAPDAACEYFAKAGRFLQGLGAINHGIVETECYNWFLQNKLIHPNAYLAFVDQNNYEREKSSIERELKFQAGKEKRAATTAAISAKYQ